MAHLWIEDVSLGTGVPEWVARPLAGSPVPLGGTAGRSGRAAGHPAALLLCRRSEQGDTWLALCASPEPVAVNGVPVAASLRVLADRDELCVPGAGRVFFSTEELPHPVPFPGTAGVVHCLRCKQAIDAGSDAVRCPACRRWFHQHADLPCWTYTEQCLCGRATALDAGFVWTPNGL